MSTRNILKSIQGNLDDSMGVRHGQTEAPLSPVAELKDVGRRSLRSFGTLPIEKVIPDPDQPRVAFDESAIEQLAQSISDQGQLHPIRVRWSIEQASWLIISGERRYRAVKQAGLATIDCYFYEGTLSTTEILEQQLIENLLRSDLRPMEEAQAFQQLIHLNGWNGKELATELHITTSKVTRALALLKLPTDIQQLVETAELSPTVAYELSKLPDAKQQRAALQQQVKTRTAKSVNSQVRQRRGASSPRRRGVKQTFVTEQEWKVAITSTRKRNYLEMEQALLEVLAEVRLRIDNNVMLS